MRMRNLGLQSRSLGLGLAGLAALAAEGWLAQPAVASAGDIGGWIFDKISGTVQQFPAVVPDMYPGTNNGINIAVGDQNNDDIPDIVTGNGPGSLDTIETTSYQQATGFSTPQILFGPGKTQYGVRVAVGDVNGDGNNEIFYSSASGSSSLVSAMWLKISLSTTAYTYPQTNGVYLAMGDAAGNGQDQIITGPSTGDPTSGVTQSPVVNVYSAANSAFTLLNSFTPFDSTYTAGVRVATGDVDGSGVDSIICGPDQGTNPTLEVYTDRKITGGTYTADKHSSLTADSYGSSQGVFLATGDVTGSGENDLITGAGPGGLPYVTVYTYDTSTSSWTFDYNFLAYPASYTGGVEVAVGDLKGDGVEDIITSPAGAISVPEPASLSVVIAGAGLLSCHRRKRRDRLLNAGG